MNKVKYTLKQLCKLEYWDKKLAVPLGEINDYQRVYMDFENVSGLFIAGATGTGKSIIIDDIIVSLMYKNTKDEVQFILLDPKKIELGEYNNSDYIMTKSEHNSLKGYDLLNYVLYLIDYRINKFMDSGKRSISQYNEKSDEVMPHIFIVADEGSDIFKTKDAINIFEKILEFGNIVGMHLIFATNDYLKPYYDKRFISLFKYRMSFDLSSIEQQKMVEIPKTAWLSNNGEARIRSFGDIIYQFQAPYVTDKEIKSVVLKSQKIDKKNV